MESFDCPEGRKKLPGKHGQQDLSAAALRQRKTPKRFKSLNFLNWHGFRSEPCRTARAWESLKAGSMGSLQRLGERQMRTGPEGSTTDAEYASDRTFTADGSGAAARCHLQQHRQREHQRLQGR